MRKGKVFADRYYAQILKSPRQVRHALAYVLNNFRKHRVYAGDVPRNLIDEYSSAPWFNGFENREASCQHDIESPIAESRTWLLNKGWRRHNRITTWEVPGAA